MMRMKSSKRLLARTVATAAVAASVLAVGAGSAFALPFGNWSAPGPYYEQGTLTLSKSGSANVTCQVDAVFSTWSNASNSYDPCSNGGQLKFGNAQMPLWNSGNPKMSFGNLAGWSWGPWGSVNGFVFQVPVVNGNATTPTRLVFDNLLIGQNQADGQAIYATGTIPMTTAGGGLVTIVPGD